MVLVDAKDACLAGWCNERMSALSSVHDQWERLQPLVDNHSEVLTVQIENLKSHLEMGIGTLRDDFERFEVRWESVVMDLESNDDISLESFENATEKWSVISQQKDGLLRSCEKYYLDFPADLNELFGKQSQDVEEKKQQWSIFKEFSAEFLSLSSEDWAIYRRRPYILSDFVSKWFSETGTHSGPAAVRIRKGIETLQAATPTLQSLQSDSLTDKHWAGIFRLLHIPYKTYLDITLKDLLVNVDLLTKNSTEIQQLVRQASSEQIVRQAITELDQWGVQAELKMFSYKDSHGQVISLIKDFQDLLSKVGSLFTRDERKR